MSPRTEGGRLPWTVIRGCLAALACCLSASWSGAAPERLACSERVSLPHGGHVRRETAELTARILARHAALRQVEAVLADLTAVRFGLDDARQLTALAAMVEPPLLSTLPPASPAFGSGEEKQAAETDSVTVQADVFVPLSALPDTVQAALARTDDLEAQAEALERVGQLAGETAELIRQAALRREQGQTDESFGVWLADLDARLRAGEGYALLLDRFGSAWTPPEEAERALRDLLRRDPGNSLINLGLAEVLLRLDRPHDALFFANEALRLEPELPRALYARGLTQLRLRFLSLAEADFSRALTLRPDKAAWWRARGAARMIRHDYEPMCADLYQACILGDCEGLAEVRGQNLCSGPP